MARPTDKEILDILDRTANLFVGIERWKGRSDYFKGDVDRVRKALKESTPKVKPKTFRMVQYDGLMYRYNDGKFECSLDDAFHWCKSINELNFFPSDIILKLANLIEHPYD